MSKKSESAEQHIKSVKRRTRRKYSAEEKIRIVLEGMRGEHSIAELCRREGIAQSQYYSWSSNRISRSNAR
jgi:transposase